jgi:two-component system cell cycle sensor histidine kinase/response regulator CckA
MSGISSPPRARAGGMTGAAVRAEQIATLYRQSVPVLLSNVVNAAIVSATVWGEEHRRFLICWTAAMATMTLARIQLRRRYWACKPGPDQAVRWGRRYVAGSTVAGLLWGGAALVLFDPARPLSQMIVTFVIGGMGAGAAGTISCYLPAFFAYLIPSVAPLALRMFLLAQPLYLGMGTMTIVYGVAIAAVARITNRALSVAFRLRFENEGLVDRLSGAQLTLEESNQTLERRVAERSQELERQGEALRNAQRMEAVGRLAGGIAHDFNNLLTIMLANVTKLLRDDGLAPVNRTALEDVRGAASRGAALVRQLLTFSRQQRTTPRTLDLNRVVGEIERLLSRLVGEQIELAVTVDPEPLLVRADASQLEQVLVNLVTNARDAMPHGGKVTIATGSVEIGASDPRLPPGPWALITVSDTGSGMDAETQRRAFDPFFTTKGVGRGTGLGLATVHGIVHQNGGHVAVRSEPGQGTRFEIHLPRLRAREAEAPIAPTAMVPDAAPATIVLAEDEPIVRSVIALSLESQGHRVLTAKDGEEALHHLETYEGRVDLLISDVVMAGMGGPELARRARALRPALRLLLISGYSWDSDLQAAGEIELLEKPFTMETLLARVAVVMARPDPRAATEV